MFFAFSGLAVIFIFIGESSRNQRMKKFLKALGIAMLICCAIVAMF